MVGSKSIPASKYTGQGNVDPRQRKERDLSTDADGGKPQTSEKAVAGPKQQPQTLPDRKPQQQSVPLAEKKTEPQLNRSGTAAEDQTVADLPEKAKVMQIEDIKENFLRSIEFDKKIALTTRKDVLNYCRAEGHGLQRRAQWILDSDEVQNWISEDDIDILVVDGNESRHDADSAVAMFSTLLHRSLNKEGTGFVLTWYCGWFTLLDSKAILENLIGQIVDKGVAKKMPIPSPDQWKNFDTEFQMDFLAQCIRRQQRKTPVYLIIDSISFYEDRRRMPELRQLVERLADGAGERDGAHPFQILITSPIRCAVFDRIRCAKTVERLFVDASV